MIVAPITKRIGIITSVEVCLILRENNNYMEMVERKAFFANLMLQYHVSQYGEHIVVLISKRMEIIMSMQVFLASWMNFDYKENRGKKSFSFRSKASISCIPIRRT